jgi:hypothetical protein
LLINLQWSVTTDSELCNISGNHVNKDEKVEEDMDVNIEEVSWPGVFCWQFAHQVTQAQVRMELQTLNRMPQTNAILFSFKTYLCPVTEIKGEGLGPLLADAIEGLRTGNAPGMWVYKGGIRWGKSVCKYLRS